MLSYPLAVAKRRVGRTTDRLVSAMEAREDSIDSLLAELDKTISLSKQVFSGSQPQMDEGTCLLSTGAVKLEVLTPRGVTQIHQLRLKQPQTGQIST
jgi:hypothetical protein